MTKLDLNDLKPAEATLALSEYPARIFTLKKFSLNAQIWVNERFGDPQAIQGIFKNLRIGEISEIVYFLLKEKDAFKSLDEFREAIVSPKDKVEMVNALLRTIGISQPIVDKLKKEADAGNEQSPSQLTGAPSTT